MPSKLEQLQLQYRRQLLQEKEERMIKIHTDSQQKALSKIARYTSNGLNSSKPPPAHHSPVKKGSPGVDRSRPLPPISKEAARTSPCSAPADTSAGKSTGPNAGGGWRSRSVDAADAVRQDRARQHHSKVSEASFELEVSHHESTTVTQVTREVAKSTGKPQNQASEPSKTADPRPPAAQATAPDKAQADQEAVARLKQAELQRVRARVREEAPTPRPTNSLSSDTFSRPSHQKRTPAAAPAPNRSKPSFQKATASFLRKAAGRPAPAAGRPAPTTGAEPRAARPPPGPGQEQCRSCGRNFNADRIAKHASICAKAAQKKVKVFDATKMRVQGTEAEQFVRKPARPENPKPKQSNWRKKHNEFIEAIRQAKMVQQHLARGGKVSDLPPPPPSDTSDYIQCPHCGRRFSEAVADRHVPKCKNILSNKKNPQPRRK